MMPLSEAQLVTEVIDNINYVQQMLKDAEQFSRGKPLPRSKSNIESQLEDAEKQVADDIQTQPQIVKQICAALKSISGDAYDIAKGITTILVTLTLNGTLNMAIEPFALALIAIVIGKMGAAAFCVG